MSEVIRINVDNRPEVIQEARQAIWRALEIIGMFAEDYAVDECPVASSHLVQSLTHAVDVSKLTVYVGTNIEYAPYVELGTGIYYEGGGRQTPWAYQDKKGNWHKTRGIQPQPFIKPAIADHVDEYKNIVETELKG